MRWPAHSFFGIWHGRDEWKALIIRVTGALKKKLINFPIHKKRK